MRWRIAAIFALLALPVVAYFVVGMAAVWRTPVLAWLWWSFPVCWAGAYLLTRYWRGRLTPAELVAPQPALHWTERDHAAWRLVEAQQQRVETLSREQLVEPTLYLQIAQEMALQLARHYRPDVRHPISARTVPEILAAVQLAIEDTAQWVDRYIPGSHLMTVGQWQSLSRAPAWLATLSNAAWAVRIVLQPTYLGQYLTSKWTSESTMNQLRDNALAWFYLAYVRYIGFYLIEMNSGRLRAGAARYRIAMRELDAARPPATGVGRSAGTPRPAPRATDTMAGPAQVSLALIGQVNAGKSSLINALLGEHKAKVDVLPQTADVKRYTLQLSDSPEKLTLLDTPGYGSTGADAEQREQTHLAVRQADIVLLVMNVTNPARQPDLAALEELIDWCANQPHLKLPIVLGVLTHADGLSPMLEWNPPYDWTKPRRPKEFSMAAAAETVQQEFAGRLAAVVPVCTDLQRQRSYGVHEWLVPAMLVLLDNARAGAVLKSLHEDLSHGQLDTLFRQLGNAGWGILKACFAESSPPRGT